MKRFLWLVVLLGSLALATAEDKFVPLFNGHDLDGWVNVNCAPNTWTATNNLIACTGVPTGELRTERMYQNFVLELEWRHLKPQGNAGVFVWADALTARGQPFVRGIEVQVLDGRESDWFTSDGDIFPIHGAKMVPVNGRGGDRAYPTEKRSKPSPEWNHYRIECVDGAIALSLNGKAVTRGHSASPRKGYICLESEGSPVEFRNIRVQELPATVALEPEHIAEPQKAFTSLYSGVDLTGWMASSNLMSVWKVKDWILHNAGGHPSEDLNLWSEKEFGDFVLVADWRAVGAEKKNENGTQIATNSPKSGISGILLRGSETNLVNIGTSVGGSGGMSHHGILPAKALDAPVGQWNRFVITCRGSRVSIELNGELVVDKQKIPGVLPRGRIALRHTGSSIEFANLFVRELD